MTAQADLKSVIGSLQRRFSRPLTKKELRQLGDLSAEAIVNRTRDGFGVVRTGARKSRLKPLSSQYIEFRKRFRSLSNDTSPKKSNLTLTGQMLESVRTKKVRQGTRGNARVIVEPGTRKLFKRAEFNALRGRIFMNLSKKELKEINQFMTKSIKSKLKRR